MYAIKWYDELDSTNNEVIRIADSLDNMSVVAALHQTAGRGQRGNAWHSAGGENLTFSIFLRFGDPSAIGNDIMKGIAAADQFRISEAATLAQCRFLKGKGIDARIKWPNDIYAGNRKISGMLVENSLSGKYLATSVVGIGLNVNQTAFPPGLPNPTSMKLQTGLGYDIRVLLEEFMEVFSGICRIMETAPGQELKRLYESELYMKDRTSIFADLSGRPAYLPANTAVMDSGEESSGDGLFKGTVTGITDTGMLKVRLADGSVREFGFKEIAYIIPRQE